VLLALVGLLARSLCPVRAEEPPPGFDYGLDVAAALQAQVGFIDDLAVQERLARIGYRVASAAESYPYPILFYGVDIEDPNAFAVPGGFIFVTRGMLDLDLPDGELAHLLGHEVAHVTQHHIERLQRKASLMALLHQALLVGVLLGVKDDPARRSVPVGVEPDPSVVQGKAALFQGVALFGEILRALFSAGFSREFELEADREGMRHAKLAGYPLQAGVDLLERLNRELYELPGMAYWRTHPYFAERLRAGKARLEEWREMGSLPPWKLEGPGQRKLLEIAPRIEDEGKRLLLLRGAIRLAPGSETAESLYRSLFSLELKHLRGTTPFLRPYGSMIAELDHAAEAIAAQRPESGFLPELRSLRGQLDAENRELYPRYLEAITAGSISTPALERFLENYPDSDRRVAARLMLAEHYRLQEEPRRAAETLLEGREELPEGEAAEDLGRIEEALRSLAPRVEDLTTLERIRAAASGEAFRAEVEARLKELAGSYEKMDNGKRFLLRYPDSPLAPRVQQRLNELGEAAYTLGRQLEAIGRVQKAVEQYNRILDNVQSPEIREKARHRLEQLQAQEE
jgi:predicted Zn-dependent protease